MGSQQGVFSQKRECFAGGRTCNLANLTLLSKMIHGIEDRAGGVFYFSRKSLAFGRDPSPKRLCSRLFGRDPAADTVPSCPSSLAVVGRPGCPLPLAVQGVRGRPGLLAKQPCDCLVLRPSARKMSPFQRDMAFVRTYFEKTNQFRFLFFVFIIC